MARNPTYDFTTPRYFTAYAESAFLYRLIIDGRNQSGQLDLTVARSFFQDRRNGSIGFDEIGADIAELLAVHEIAPGHNGGAGNLCCPALQLCYLYTKHVSVTLRTLSQVSCGRRSGII